MSDVCQLDTASLPLSLARRLDDVCRRFEDAWAAGQQSAIETYLHEAPDLETEPSGCSSSQTAALLGPPASRLRGARSPWIKTDQTAGTVSIRHPRISGPARLMSL